MSGRSWRSKQDSGGCRGAHSVLRQPKVHLQILDRTVRNKIAALTDFIPTFPPCPLEVHGGEFCDLLMDAWWSRQMSTGAVR
jgi:hypothetical protein